MKQTRRIALLVAAAVSGAATFLSVGAPAAWAALAPAPVLTPGPCSLSATWTGADEVQLNVGSSQTYVQGDTVQAQYGTDYIVPAGQPVMVEVSAFINGSYATNYFSTITPACNTGSNLQITKVVQGPTPVGGQYTIELYPEPSNVVSCNNAYGAPVSRFDIARTGGSVVLPVVPGQQYCVVELDPDGAIFTTYTNQLITAAPAGSVDAVVTNNFNGVHLRQLESWIHNGAAADPLSIGVVGATAYIAHVYDATSSEVAILLCNTFANQGTELTCPTGAPSLPAGGTVVFKSLTAPAGWPLHDFTITDADCPGVANGDTCTVTLTNTLDDAPAGGGETPATTTPDTVPATTPSTVPTTDGAAGPATSVELPAATVSDPVAAPASEAVGPFVPSGDVRLPETGGTDGRLVVGAVAALLLGLGLTRIGTTARSTSADDLL